MRRVLGTSARLAAAGSAKGPSRYGCEPSATQGRELVTPVYGVEETDRHAPKLGTRAPAYWRASPLPRLALVPVELSFDKVPVFPKAKGHPVLLSALGAVQRFYSHPAKLISRK